MAVSLPAILLVLGHLSITCYGLDDANTTTVTTTPSTTTLPPNPGVVMFIIIPVSILVGIPVFIVGFCCLTSMIKSAQKRKEAHTNSRRVTPINGDPEGSRVRRSADDEMFAYDGNYSNDTRGGGEYEAQPQYTYGWDF